MFREFANKYIKVHVGHGESAENGLWLLMTSIVVGAGMISFANMDIQVTTFWIKYLESGD